MKSWKLLRKLSVFSAGTVSGAVALYYFSEMREKTNFATSIPFTKEVFNSWTTNSFPSACGKWDENWDHRDPKSSLKPIKKNADSEDENSYNEKLEKLKAKSVRHVILIRHGQYYLNGKTDVQRVLTDLGREQAQFTGKRLKSLTLPWDVIVQSTMTRAMETCSIITNELNQNIKVESDPLLEEGAPIPPEPAVGHWKPEASFFVDGCRIEAAFRKYFHRAEPEQQVDSYTLIVCHANVIRYFVCRALQFPPEAWLRLSLNHASITWLSILPSGRVILRQFGDSGHMPMAFVTSANSVK